MTLIQKKLTSRCSQLACACVSRTGNVRDNELTVRGHSRTGACSGSWCRYCVLWTQNNILNHPAQELLLTPEIILGGEETQTAQGIENAHSSDHTDGSQRTSMDILSFEPCKNSFNQIGSTPLTRLDRRENWGSEKLSNLIKDIRFILPLQVKKSPRLTERGLAGMTGKGRGAWPQCWAQTKTLTLSGLPQSLPLISASLASFSQASCLSSSRLTSW